MSSLYYLTFSFVCFYLIFNCFIEQGSAIKCYECNSHIEPDCAMDPPPDKLAKNCTNIDNQPRTMCRKITQVIEFEVNGLQPDSRVIRTCGWDESNYVNKCYHRSGFGGRQEVCSCKTDLCNGASFLTTTQNIIIVGIATYLSVVYLLNSHV